MRLLLLLAALGCADDTPSTDSPTDTSDTETGRVDSADTADSRTSDSAATDTAPDTDTAPEPDPGFLAVSPRELVVDAGASWPLRVVHHLDGAIADVAAGWESSDPGVVTVDADGVATALAPGEVTLTAWHDGLSTHAAVQVQDSPWLRVQLIAAETGLPLAAATVTVDGQTVAVDPLTGVAELSITPGVPLELTALADDDSRIPTTVKDVVGRQLVVPLRTRGQLEPDSEIQGTFDFSNLPPLSEDEKAAGWVVLGIAGGSLRLGPLFWRADEVLSPNRDVELYGLTVSVPGNLAIDEYFDDWQAPAWSGDAGVWSMAGPVPLAEAILGLSTLDAALDFLLTNMDGFVYSHDPALTVPADGPLALQVAPATSLSQEVVVELPSWPEGVALDNPATLVALDGQGSEGPTVAGFGRGFPGTNGLARVPGSFFGWDGSAAQVLAYLEVGGLGTLGAKVLRVAPVIDGVATLGEFQDPPVVNGWDEPALLLDVSLDPDVDLAYIYLSNRAGDERDYYLQRPEAPVDITLVGPEFGMGTLTFEVGAVETHSGTYEGWFSEGAVLRQDLAPLATSTGFVTGKFKVDTEEELAEQSEP